MPPGSSTTLRDWDGNVVSVPAEKAQELLDRGYTPETDVQRAERTTAAVKEDLYGGVGGAIKAGAAGLLSGLTVGASDVVGAALGGRQRLKGLQEENPGVAITSNIAGAVLPAIVTAGASAPGSAAGIGARILARSPAALASRAGIAVGEAAVGGGAGLGARVAAGALGAGVEGAIQGGGQYLSQVALEDRPLSAEGFVAGMGTGALFAAPIGGAFTAGARALTRARALFPKAEVTAKAAQGVKQEAVSEIVTAVSDGEAMAAAAARRLAMAEAKTGMAEAGERTTRRLFGASDPAALGDQVAAGAEAAQLKEALQGYQASKAQLDEWIRSQADLDDVLAGLQAPEVQVGAPTSYRRPSWALDEAPGAARPRPLDEADLGRLAEGTPTPSREAATAVGRRPGVIAEGTPAGADKEIAQALGMPTAVGRKAPAELLSGVAAPAGAPGAAPGGGSLESLLAGTKQQLDAGRSLSEIGGASPLRKAYVTGKELDTGRPLTQKPTPVEAKAEAQALFQWQNGRGAEINDYARSGKLGEGSFFDSPEQAKETLDAIDRAIARGATDADQVVFRGIGTGSRGAARGIKGELKVGSIIEDPGYSATTTDRRVGLRYANKGGTSSMLEIELPKGSKHARLDDDDLGEAEILLPRGSKFEILSVRNETIDGRTVKVGRARLVGDEAPTATVPMEFSVNHKFLGETPIRITTETKDVGGGKITTVRATHSDGTFVGEAKFTHQDGKLLPDEATVDGPWQRLGIGTKMYESAEATTGLKVAPGKRQTEAGEAFSAQYRGARDVTPSRFTRTDRAAGGSQGGAWYRDESGQEWFGKHYRGDTDRLEGEHLASQIYRTLGVSAPETRIAEIGGKRVLLSKEIKGSHADNTQVLRATDVKNGFVVDAWLNNRDVIGTGKDNIIVSGDKAHRIDAGGATIWRATGGDKTFVAKVKELESMRDPSREAGRVFGQLSPDEVRKQLDDFVKTHEAKRAEIDKLIDDSGLSDAAKEKIKTGLNDRAAWLKTEAKGRPADLSDEEFNAYAASSAEGLPDDIRDSMLRYSGQGTYARINKKLREGAGKLGFSNIDKDAIPVIESIDRGMAMSPTPRDMVVYRGINDKAGGQALSGLKVGDVYVDHGFGSTSYLKEIGQEYAKGFGVYEPIELHISVPKGHPAFPIPSQFPKEREILIARGGRYIVTDVSTAPNGHKIIKMSVRAPDKFDVKPMPAGFAMDAATEYGPVFSPNAHVKHGLPEHAEMDGVRTNDLIVVARPSELAAARTFGKAPKPEVLEVPTGGTPPVRIGFYRGKDGKTEYLVLGGEQTLLDAAANGDAPVVISLRQAATTKGFKPIEGDIQKALTPVDLPAETGLEQMLRAQRGALSDVERAPLAADDDGDLLALLAATKQRFDAGEPLKGMTATSPEPTAIGRDILESQLGPQITRVLGKRAGNNVDMGPELARAAKVIGDHEASLAHLADALGPDAPTSATSRAGKYREATRAQADSMASSAAKAAEDLSARGPGTTVVDDEIAKALQQADMRAGRAPAPADRTVVDPMPLGRMPPAPTDRTAVDSEITRALRQAEMRAPAPAAPVASPAPAARGRLGLLADVGTALEVLQTMGVGVPDIDKIPIIGPVLSVYLKARAVMGILGRKGGSIGRSAESLVASKGAAARDRIAAATTRILEGTAKAAKAGARAAGPAALLATKLFPGGAEPKSNDPYALYDARTDEISRALQPGAISRAVDDRILTADAELQQAITGQVERGLKFLESKRPKQTALPGMLPGDGEWKPSRASLEVWGRYVIAVNDPVSVLEDLARGQATIEGAETLRTVYPRLFQEAQRLLLEAAPKMQKTLPYARRMAISIMYQVPIDSTMTPQHLQFLTAPGPGAAAAVPAPAAPGAPAILGPLQAGQQTMPSLDRRAGM